MKDPKVVGNLRQYKKMRYIFELYHLYRYIHYELAGEITYTYVTVTNLYDYVFGKYY